MGVMRDAVVIGGGVIGATVARSLRQRGLDTVLLDDRRQGSGTYPSGGHLNPAWFRGMRPDQYRPALDQLDRCWGLVREQFVVYPRGRSTLIYRVDTDVVLAEQTTAETVRQVNHWGNYPEVVTDQGSHRCRLLVVAAGVWSNSLLPTSVAIISKSGVSFRVSCRLARPFIKPWAPYKQVVAHQQTLDEVWVGDGSSIISENWTDERTEQCWGRCNDALGDGTLTSTRLGYRPYVATREPCYLRQLGPRAWVATGAGKLGTIAAGWATLRIMSSLDRRGL